MRFCAGLGYTRLVQCHLSLLPFQVASVDDVMNHCAECKQFGEQLKNGDNISAAPPSERVSHVHIVNGRKGDDKNDQVSLRQQGKQFLLRPRT